MSISTAVERKRSPCAIARFVRSASSPGDSTSAGAATRRSPGRSANRASVRSAAVTPSAAATEATTAAGCSRERAASAKTVARARRGRIVAATPVTGEDVSGDPALHCGTRTRELLAQALVQLTLATADESRVLLQQHAKP